MATHCTITVLQEPLTVEGESFDVKIESTFSKEWLAEFKSITYRDDRYWSEGARCWYVKLGLFPLACKLAEKYFDLAEVIEGDTTTNLKTRQAVEQGRLF